MSHNAKLLKSYQINKFYANQIDNFDYKDISPKIKEKITLAYKKHDIFTLRKFYDMQGDKILRYVICMSIVLSKDFNIAKYFLKNKFENVCSYSIITEPILNQYEYNTNQLIKLTKEMEQEDDFLYWNKLFLSDTHRSEFKHIYIVRRFELPKKQFKHNFELSQLEFLELPFKQHEQKKQPEHFFIKNCLYLLCSEMLTEKNFYENTIVDFQKQKLNINDLRFQNKFIQILLKLDNKNRKEMKKFIDKFKIVANEDQKNILTKLINKIKI